MTTRYYTYSELLAQLKDNVSRSSLPRSPAITHIRQFSSRIKVTVSLDLYLTGPNYYVYPSWDTDNLANWWALSVEKGRDSRGNNPGTIYGAPVSGKDNISLIAFRFNMKFNGNGDYLDLGDITNLDNTQRFTICFRCNPEISSGEGSILSRWSAANSNRQFSIGITDEGELVCQLARNSTGGMSRATTPENLIPNDEWSNVVIVYNGTAAGNDNRLRIYINGVRSYPTFAGNVPANLRSVSGSVLIGRQANSVGNDFEGKIADVARYTDSKSGSFASEYSEDDISDRIVAGLFRPA